MKRRLQIAGFFLAYCVIATVVSLWDGEPRWEGRKAREWVVELRPFQFTMANDLRRDDWEERHGDLVRRHAKAREAIRAIGPAAVPYLLRLLEAEQEPGVAQWWANLITSKRSGPLDPAEQRLRLDRAVAGFEALGEQAATAIPRLTGHLEDRRTRWHAARCLQAIGKPAAPVVISGLSHHDWEVRHACLEVLWLAGTNASSTLPAVRRLSSDTNEFVRGLACLTVANLETNRAARLRLLTDILDAGGPGNWGEAKAFQFHATRPDSQDEETDRLIARLMKHARSTNTQVAVFSFQTWAAFAARSENVRKAIIAAASDADEQVRQSAAVALASLDINDPEVLAALAHCARIDPVPPYRDRAINALARFGESAVAAAPDLEAEIRKAMEFLRRRKIIETAWNTPP